MRACLYTRISTDEEHQPTSLHTQRERLEAFCKAQEGWSIVAHHEDQSTGAKLDRPGLQAALDLARRQEIDQLLGRVVPEQISPGTHVAVWRRKCDDRIDQNGRIRARAQALDRVRRIGIAVVEVRRGC